MRAWLAEMLRVTANHLSPIKPMVMKQDMHLMPGVNETLSAVVARAAMTHTRR